MEWCPRYVELKEALEELGSAVVMQAVKDWVTADKKLKAGKSTTTAKITKDECERFFRSERFKLFTKIRGEELIHRLETEDTIL